MKKLIDKLHNNDANNDIVTPSSSDTSDEGNNVELTVNEMSHAVVDIENNNNDQSVYVTGRPSTPELLLDVSGNNL
jgi:hypothetical protein